MFPSELRVKAASVTQSGGRTKLRLFGANSEDMETKYEDMNVNDNTPTYPVTFFVPLPDLVSAPLPVPVSNLCLHTCSSSVETH